MAGLRRLLTHGQQAGAAFAQLHGLVDTDLRALIAVRDAESAADPLTPGRLADHLDLSPGSVTALLDRLERAGHLRRDRDGADRRRLLLRDAVQGTSLAEEFRRPLDTAADAAMATLSDDELVVVSRFLAAVADGLRAQRDAARRGRSGRAPSRVSEIIPAQPASGADQGAVVRERDSRGASVRKTDI
nr:MarR family transcriptional regulator [Micromonospora yangpuensis]